MITISTLMYHHCGPRVAFCAATNRGSVCALAVDRNSASRYSFQARMNTRRLVATSPGRARGKTISTKMRSFDAPSSSADSSISFGIETKKSYINHTTMGMLTVV